jgi:hypothetical protein
VDAVLKFIYETAVLLNEFYNLFILFSVFCGQLIVKCSRNYFQPPEFIVDIENVDENLILCNAPSGGD